MTQPPSGHWQQRPAENYPGPLPPQWNPMASRTQPPQKPGPWKWIAGGAALIAVIAITAVVAVSLDRRSDASAATPAQSDVASAGDTGAIGIITDDPSCAPWRPVVTTLANVENNGWAKRDPSIPVGAWTPDVRDQYQAVAAAMRSAADQALPLAKLTTHRVVRELYEQFIAYTRAFVDRLPSYQAADNDLAIVSSTVSDVLTGICEAIANGSAAARGPVVSAAAAPDHVAAVGDLATPSRFLATGDPQCSSWKQSADTMKTNPAIAAWSTEDPAIPASSWSPEYKAQNDAVKPVLSGFADTYDHLARASSASNPVLADFGVLAAQYGRAFVAGIPTYTAADLYLFNVFQKAAGVITSSCRAAGIQ